MSRALLSAIDRIQMRRKGGAHLNTLALYGTYRCAHRSHLLRLRCLRPWVYEFMCSRHLNSCMDGCK